MFRVIPLLVILILKRRLTFRKLYGLFLNFLCGYILRIKGRAPYPSIMMIEPTNICNLSCSFCALQFDGGVSREEKRRAIDIELYKTIIDESKDHLLFLFLYFGGETFLHKNVFELIKYASDRGISVIIATNGAFDHIPKFGTRVLEADLDVLIFSISGTKQEVYGEFHKGGQIDNVIRNIRAVTSMKDRRRPRVIIRYIATPQNSNDIKNLESFATALNADSFEVRSVDGEPVLTDNFSSLNNLEKKQKNNGSRQCFWLWGSLVVKSSGAVIPCCYDYYGPPEMGNLYQSSLSEIWNGFKINEFRQKWIKNPEMLDCCAQCNYSSGWQDDASKGQSKIPVRKQRT